MEVKTNVFITFLTNELDGSKVEPTLIRGPLAV